VKLTLNVLEIREIKVHERNKQKDVFLVRIEFIYVNLHSQEGTLCLHFFYAIHMHL